MSGSNQMELDPQYQTSAFSSGSFLFEGIARRGPGIAELVEVAARLDAPKKIITADCSNPHEIDDGYSVRPLPSAREVYQVDVCVADASSLYANTDVLQTAMSLTRAEYFTLDDGEQGYEPMFPEQYILQKQLTKAALKGAVVISFVVGDHVPPCDLNVTFEKVEVQKNYNYRQFSELSVPGLKLEDYARAAGFIQQGLRYSPGGDKLPTVPLQPSANVPQASKLSVWKSGSKMNEAFMVASNHLVGKMMRDEGRAAIYRVHGNAGDMHGEILPRDVAWFTREPGFHDGLGIGPYCPSTSPLRRLQDFVMHYHLWLRDNNKTPTQNDLKIMDDAILSLNRRAIYDSVARTLPRRPNHLKVAQIAKEAVA